MDITLRIALLVASVLFLTFVLLRVRRGWYLLKYSLIWIILSAVGVVCAIFPEGLFSLAYILGFSVPSNFVYFVLIGALFIANLILCGVLSRQEVMLKSLVQELSILKSERNGDTDAQKEQ